jgi:hypothetical protein
MAPEVANGRYGKEIDIYALGIILYESLTGHVPFEGESVGEVLMKHLTAEPSLSEIPAAYREVIARALAKDPALRFASVAEMMNALPPLAATMAYRPPLKETRLAGEAEPVAAAAASSPPPPQPQPQGMYAAAAAPIAAAALTDDEPIWRAIREAWQTTRNHWDNFNTPTKVVVAVVGCIALANNAALVIQLGTPLVVFYALYRIVRSVVMHQETKRQASAGGTTPVSGSPRPAWQPYRPVNSPGPARSESALDATQYHPSSESIQPGDWRKASQRHWKKKSKKKWREQAAAALVVKGPRERLADLTGAMLMAAAIGAAMSVVVMLLRGESFDKSQYAWLSMVSIGGAWAVLIPSKAWEGTHGDTVLRRVVMLILGLAVGGGAFVAASDMLMIDFPDSRSPHSLLIRDIGENFYDAKGHPLLYAYLAYFGALYFVVAWWRQADPLRYARLSVWTTAVCVFWAWMINYLWPFPQPWGLMVAAIVSISVQLASPAVPHYQRIGRPANQE